MEQARESKIENSQEQVLAETQDLTIETNLLNTNPMIQGEGFLMSDEATPKKRTRYCEAVIVGNNNTIG
jgi:hypothetical protein